MQKQRQEVAASKPVATSPPAGTRTLSVYASVHGHAQAVIIPRPGPKSALNTYS